MIYDRALFKCLSCGRKTPEGLLCKAHAGDVGKHFHTLRREAREAGTWTVSATTANTGPQ